MSGIKKADAKKPEDADFEEPPDPDEAELDDLNEADDDDRPEHAFGKALAMIAKGADDDHCECGAMKASGDKLCKACKVKLTMAKGASLVDAFADAVAAGSLEKGAGEGSRGGKVLEHTASGKPIYEHAGHSEKQTSARYAGWTLADHKEAMNRFHAQLPTNPPAHYSSMDKFHFEMMVHSSAHAKGSDAEMHGSPESHRAGKHAKQASKQFSQHAKDNPETEAMAKGEGEGSRGGKIIGHTGCLDAETFVAYQVRSATGALRNHKGGTIARLFHRFHGIPQKGSGLFRAEDDGQVFCAQSIDEDGHVFINKIIDVVRSGRKPCVAITTAHGTIVATREHRFWTGDTYVEAGSLVVGDDVHIHNNSTRSGTAEKAARIHCHVKQHPVAGVHVVKDRPEGLPVREYRYHRLAKARAVVEADMNGLAFDAFIARLNSDDSIDDLVFLPREVHVHHKNEDCRDDRLENLETMTPSAHGNLHREERDFAHKYVSVPMPILSIEDVGERETFDVCMDPPYNNFVAGGFVVHNSGKPIYATLGGYQGAGHKMGDYAGDGSAVGYQGKGHEGWSAKDHHDAASKHREEAKDQYGGESGRLAHQSLARAHEEATKQKGSDPPAAAPKAEAKPAAPNAEHPGGVHPAVHAALKDIDAGKAGAFGEHAEAALKTGLVKKDPKGQMKLTPKGKEALNDGNLGKTKSGKPIGAGRDFEKKNLSGAAFGVHSEEEKSKFASQHEGWSAQDHKDAASAHDDAQSSSKSEVAKDRHYAMRSAHERSAKEKSAQKSFAEADEAIDALEKGFGPPVMASPEMEKQKAKAEREQREAAGIKNPVKAAHDAEKRDMDPVEKADDEEEVSGGAIAKAIIGDVEQDPPEKLAKSDAPVLVRKLVGEAPSIYLPEPRTPHPVRSQMLRTR